ncbi:hypothetical protein [Paraburkholderia sediminicola]|uniref:hypothetical protein n=1 Tax=Paraburkholderia sediminicola TaxID=458836 RepID=UPI0038BD1B8C
MGELPIDAVGQPIEVSLDQESLGLEASAWFVNAVRRRGQHRQAGDDCPRELAKGPIVDFHRDEEISRHQVGYLGACVSGITDIVSPRAVLDRRKWKQRILLADVDNPLGQFQHQQTGVFEIGQDVVYSTCLETVNLARPAS